MDVLTEMMWILNKHSYLDIAKAIEYLMIGI